MSENITPIRQQYLRIKKQYPNVIVFFRLGDFYETFDEDARVSSKELDIVLTSRNMGKGNSIPMAGIPYHSVDSYLAKLIARGYKVAIVEQMTKPGETKGLVEREVVRLVTPGTIVEPSLLNAKINNYLASLVIDNDRAGLAFVDITTGEFAATQTNISRALNELERLQPSEIILPKSIDTTILRRSPPLTPLEDYDFDIEATTKNLLEHFEVITLDGFGCGNLPLAIRAAGSVIQYLRETQKSALGQLRSLSTYSPDSFMVLDTQTQNNLEIFKTTSSGKAENSLLSVLDLTKTPMGSRLMRKWLGQPLLSLDELILRQEAVEWFYQNSLLRKQVIVLLGSVGDLERSVNRINGNLALPREILSLKRGLEILPQVKDLLESSPLEFAKKELRPQPHLVE